MGAIYTDAQAKASAKHLKEKLDCISLRVPKGVREEYRQAAESVGESLNQFVIKAIEDRIGRL